MIPLLTTSARWTGPLLCLAEGFWEADGAAARWHSYIATGEAPEGVEGLPTVTVRPLTSAEAYACEVQAGPVPALAAFTHRSMLDRGLVEGTREHAAAVDGLPEDERQSLHAAALRRHRLHLARAQAGIVAASWAPEGVSPGDALSLIADIDAQRIICAEVAGHIDRVGVLRPAGKATAGPR